MPSIDSRDIENTSNSTGLLKTVKKGEKEDAADSDAITSTERTEDIAPAARPKRAERQQLPQLTGVRTLVATWILMHHMAPQKPASGISIFVMRVDVAVEMFFMLSGFMTHYAYGDKDFTSSAGSLISFYVRRLARVCLTTQAGMLFCIFWWWFGGKEVLTLHSLSCLTFTRTWYDPEPDCPDAPGWFVAALIPSWILYPIVTRRVLMDNSSSPRSLLRLCGILWLAAIGPGVVMIILQGDWMSWQQIKLTWFWPPSQIADFALGAAVAALLQAAPPAKSTGVYADVIFVFVLAVCIFLPVAETPDDWTGPIFRPGHYMAWDGLLARLSAPFLAAWIYYSSSGDCISARFMSHSILVPAGAYTLEVYLFQTPLHDLFTWTKEVMWLPEASTEVFVMYMFLLWVVSVMFVDLLATPADKWLRGATNEWTDKPLSYFFGQSASYVSVAAEPI